MGLQRWSLPTRVPAGHALWKTDPMGPDTIALRARSNDALRRRDWPEVLRSLSAADPNELDGDDLLALYEAECAAEADRHRLQSVIELAHAAYVRDDDMEGASWTALQMIIIATVNHELDLARAWQSSLMRTMEGLADCKVHVYVSIALSLGAMYDGDYDSIIAMVREAQELARRLGERDLEIWARQREAIATVRSGDYERGLAMLDETMVGSLSIDVRPSIRGALMCHGVSLCQHVGDLPRAAKWIEAADRSFAACGFNLSGECHMHRAEVLKMRGSLARAEVEARLGCDGYPWDNHHAGWGWVQVGEIRMRLGDLEGAEEAFVVAYSLDYLPDPGLAMLRLAQGRPKAAATEIVRALDVASPNWLAKPAAPADSPESPDRLRRVGLLAAAVTIFIANGDLGAAEAADAELAALVATYPSDVFQVTAACAQGELRVAQGRLAEAVGLLRGGVSTWLQVGAPYEAAHARLQLAEALAASGDTDGALMELKVAGRAFQELGAERDEQHAASRLLALGDSAPSDADSPRFDRTFMFTDIERSTALATAMGEEEWDRVLQWHDRLLAECISAHTGTVVKHEGDGVFAAFEDPDGAVAAAVQIQRRLASHRENHGFAPAVRVGLHAGNAIGRNGDFFGMAVNTAARVMGLASGGEIVASDSVAAVCGTRAVDPRSIELKGLAAPTPVVTVMWQS
jgi:class 3 adenylate cyclase